MVLDCVINILFFSETSQYTSKYVYWSVKTKKNWESEIYIDNSK